MATAVHRRTFFAKVYVLLACATCGIGVAILVGGAQRFSEPDFLGLRQLLGWLPFFGAWGWWGLLFVIMGVGLGLCMDRPGAKWLLRAYLVVTAFLTITFIQSLVNSTAVSALWIVSSLFLAALCLFMSDHLEHYGWQA